MSDLHHDTTPRGGQTIERHEIVERTTATGTEPRGGAGASLNWLILTVLLLVVVGLVWFIFSRGEPQQPLQNLEINAPSLEVPTVREERRIEVQLPATGGETPTPTQPQPQPQPQPQGQP